jgi:hypothetical protein
MSVAYPPPSDADERRVAMFANALRLDAESAPSEAAVAAALDLARDANDDPGPEAEAAG